MYRLINDQKRDVIAKHQRLNLCTFTLFESDTDRDIEEFWDLRAIQFKEFVANTLKAACQFMGNRSRPTEEIKMALQSNIQTPVIKQWAITKNLIDLSVLIDDWLAVQELKSFDIHLTKMESWPDGLWMYFREVVAHYGLKLVRRKVTGRTTASKHKKSKKKDTATVLFNKYDTTLVVD